MHKLIKTIKYGLFFVFLMPLAFTPFTMYPWHFGKTIIFLMIIEILGILALFVFDKGEGDKIILNKLDWIILFFLLAQIISAIAGVNFNKSFWPFQIRAQGVFALAHFILFYFLLRFFIRDREEWYKLGIWILSISFISSIIAWAGPHIKFFTPFMEGSDRISGMIGNPLFFASYIMIPVFLGFAWFYIFNEKKLKWLWVIIAVINLITMLATRTRGTFVGATAGAFIIFIVLVFTEKRKKIKYGLVGLGVLILVSGAFLFVFNRRSEFLAKKNQALSRLLDINIYSTTADTRLMAWDIAIKAFKDKPFLGCGAENYQDAFDKYYNPNFLKYSFAETVWDKPHNYPLEILVTSGIFGFLLYIGIFSVFIYFAVKIYLNEENNKLRLGWLILTFGMVAYFIQNCFAFESSNSLMLWIFVLAFASSIYLNKEKTTNQVLTKMAKFEKIKNIFVLCAIVLLFFGILENYKFLKSSYYMGKTRDAANMLSIYQWEKNALATLDINSPFLAENAIFITKDLTDIDNSDKLNKDVLVKIGPKLIEIFKNNINKYPNTYLYRFWLGHVYGYMAEYVDFKYYDDAEYVLNKAWYINKDRQHIPLLLSKNYLIQNKNKKAIEILENLAVKSDEFGEPYWFLGLAYMKDGDREKGIENLEKGVELGFGLEHKGNVLYLIDIYAEDKNYEKIIPLYEKLIASEPDNAQFYANLAANYAELGNIEKTIENLNKAVELEPSLKNEATQFLKEHNINLN